MKIISKSVEIGGRLLTLEVGRLAEQATASVLAKYGDTMVLATVVASKQPSNLSYFPLSVEYIERLYAGGRIKGSRWVKREGRPSDDAILKGRVIDRSIRPLFDKNYHHDIQVIITILSIDGENEPDILGLVATSAALAISPIPWDGPIGAVRVGYVPPKNGNPGFFINPRLKEYEFSELDLIVSSTDKKVVMLEAGSNEIPESAVYEAIKFAKTEIVKVIGCINELVKEVGQKKIVIEKTGEENILYDLIKKKYYHRVEKSSLAKANKSDDGEDLALICSDIQKDLDEKYDKNAIEKVLNTLFEEKIREDILKKKIRHDKRAVDEIRPISAEVGILPRTHGSAIFKRGETQVLTIATLGSPSLEQLIESPEGETSKRYMHHYSMPPYSVGETGRIGTPSRREVGHGALAERALLPVIPSQESFPYTIRLVSEIMSSNGSTSMASTCGSTLALMDAGVPIKSPVAGISIGLVSESDTKYILLTDIAGIEDFSGEMDFKVAGTAKGITAIQLDVKNHGITDEIIEKTFVLANKAKMLILEKMSQTIRTPRTNLSRYAPRVSIIKVPQEKIGEVIGPGGKVIRHIIAETGCEVNVDDDGNVTITGTDPAKVEMAHRWISGIVKDVQPEEIYEGIVKRILPFGAFVEILPGKEGMVHVSQMSTGFVSDPNTIVKIDQRVKVRVIEVDNMGRINLSMLFGEDAKKRPDNKPERREGRFDRPRRRY